jgi:hypothetical protein
MIRGATCVEADGVPSVTPFESTSFAYEMPLVPRGTWRSTRISDFIGYNSRFTVSRKIAVNALVAGRETA